MSHTPRDVLGAPPLTKEQEEERLQSNKFVAHFLEGILRVTLAGFGGAVAGMAITRQVYSSAQELRRGGKAQRSNLPYNWAVACMGFAIVVEGTRLASPVRKIGTFVNAERYVSSYLDPKQIEFGYVVGDYTLGGAVAGAAYRGMNVPSSTAKKLKQGARPALSPRILGGLGAGVVLGMFAGLVQASYEYLEKEMEEEEAQARHEFEERMKDQVRELAKAEAARDLRREA